MIYDGFDDNGEDIGGNLAELYDMEPELEPDIVVPSLSKSPKDYYIITCRSPYTGNLLYYQDRSKQKERFWSESSEDVFQFRSKIAAENYWKRLRYNHPQVWLVKPGIGMAILIKG